MGPGRRRRRSGRSRRTFPVWSGALVTAGDVVFYGTMDGWFKAVDARTGKIAVAVQDRLGHHRPARHLRGPDGKQYVAILAGVGGWSGAIVAGDLDRATAPQPLARHAMSDLKNVTTGGPSMSSPFRKRRCGALIRLAAWQRCGSLPHRSARLCRP